MSWSHLRIKYNAKASHNDTVGIVRAVARKKGFVVVDEGFVEEVGYGLVTLQREGWKSEPMKARTAYDWLIAVEMDAR